MKTLICLTMLACHSPKKLSVPLLVAAEFDAATTYNALSNCTTCHEINPLLRPVARTPLVFPALWVAGNVTLDLSRHVSKRHRILGRAMLAGAIGLHIFGGVNNIRLAEQPYR